MKKTLAQTLEEHSKMEEIRAKVEEFTGINVYNIGRKCNRDYAMAKRIFWRSCFFKGLTGSTLSSYTGDSSRFTALAGRRTHIKLCKTDKSVENEWIRFKQYCKL